MPALPTVVKQPGIEGQKLDEQIKGGDDVKTDLNKNKPEQSEEETNLPPVQPIHFVYIQRFVEMEPGGESFVDQVHNVSGWAYVQLR